ncbi:MAG: flagellar protein FliS [Gammaproteobacteria bacterium]|nr:flagellar protein FliS [Gammaproteobacteria bacterium]
MNRNAATIKITPPLQGEALNKIWADDPMQIIIMLFDKSLLHISHARATLTGWSNESYQSSILKAVAVIERLQMTLDHQLNPSMSANMDDIYRYVSRLLVDSIQNKNQQSLHQATALLVQLRESLSVFVKKTPKLSQH